MRFVALAFLATQLLTGCEACCNSVDVVDSRVAIALDVNRAFQQGSQEVASVLEEHGLTLVDFEDLMAQVAEDPALSLAFVRGARQVE